MAKWLEQESQWHEMYCHDLEVMSSNPIQIELGTHWDTFIRDNYSTVGGERGCRVSKVQASTTSPMPDYKGFKLQ